MSCYYRHEFNLSLILSLSCHSLNQLPNEMQKWRRILEQRALGSFPCKKCHLKLNSSTSPKLQRLDLTMFIKSINSAFALPHPETWTMGMIMKDGDEGQSKLISVRSVGASPIWDITRLSSHYIVCGERMNNHFCISLPGQWRCTRKAWERCWIKMSRRDVSLVPRAHIYREC